MSTDPGPGPGGNAAPTPPPTAHERPEGDRSSSGTRWVLGAAVIAAICCAGPAVVAAFGVGAFGAGLGLGLGVAALVVPTALGLVVAVVFLRPRR